MDNHFTGTAAGISRRDLFLMLTSGIVLPSHVAAAGSKTGPAAKFESAWEAKGRIDAEKGIFHPPYDRIAWTYAENRDDADAQYRRGYWREFERLRFVNGVYDLL